MGCKFNAFYFYYQNKLKVFYEKKLIGLFFYLLNLPLLCIVLFFAFTKAFFIYFQAIAHIFYYMNPHSPDLHATQFPIPYTIQNGSFFSYALPHGWKVAEEGQFALVLVAQDFAALTIVVGNSGLPSYYNPGQYTYEKLLAAQYQGLQLGQARPSAPIAGCTYAWEFDYLYYVNSVPCQGLAICSVAPNYDFCTMVLTCAASQSSQWTYYAAWLPQIARMCSANNGAAFGMRGILQQNLYNSQILGENARQNREWSQQTWQQVSDQRSASQERNNFEFRENLGQVQTYVNPYDTRVPVELPTTHTYYWVNRQGNIWGTDDPSANPNAGSTLEWIQMPKYKP